MTTKVPQLLFLLASRSRLISRLIVKWSKRISKKFSSLQQSLFLRIGASTKPRRVSFSTELRSLRARHATQDTRFEALAKWEDSVERFQDSATTNLEPGEIVYQKIERRVATGGPFSLRELTYADLPKGYVFNRVLELSARSRTVDLAPNPLVGLPVMDTLAFGKFIEGKTIAVIANSGALVESRRGYEIDNHDLVVRFNSFQLIPEDNGARTDIHVSIHLYSFNLEEKVAVRLLFSGSPVKWKNSMKNKILPGAQAWIGGPDLRNPIETALQQNTKMMPSTGFNMIRLLHFIGNASKISLYGFDGYKEGILRTEDASKLPISKNHSYESELEWIHSHSKFLDPLTRSMYLTSTGFSG